MLTGIDHIDIAVDDLEKWTTFFEAIGFTVIKRTVHGGGSVELSFPGVDKPFLELTSTTRPNGNTFPAGFRHIALKAPDMDAAYAELTARGVTIDRPPRRNPESHRQTMNAIDPDGGMIIQFVD